MSKVTAGIMRINQELDKISGLDGIVADKIGQLEIYVKSMVEDILDNHSEASIFNYWGNDKSAVSNILDEFEKEPPIEEIAVKGNVIITKEYLDGETNLRTKYQIIKYNGAFYFSEFDDKGYTMFKKIR